MSSGHSDGIPGTAAAADNRDCSPDRGDGEREERDAAAVTPKTASGTAAALASEDAKRLTGAAISRAEPTAGGPGANGAVDVGRSMLDEISVLKKQQKEAWEAKKMVQKQLRNAERRRKRLKKRASKLSDSDLLAVISLRNHEKVAGLLAATDEGDEENAKEIQDDPGASSSSAAPSKATTKPTSKKPRSS